MNKMYNANWFNVFLSFSIKVELAYIFGVQNKQIKTKKVISILLGHVNLLLHTQSLDGEIKESAACWSDSTDRRFLDLFFHVVMDDSG